MSERKTSTYSMWCLFRNCRKAAHWRYVLELVPLEKDRNLSFGSLIHACLETWHRTRDLEVLVDDRLRHAGHVVLLGEGDELVRLDHVCPDHVRFYGHLMGEPHD